MIVVEFTQQAACEFIVNNNLHARRRKEDGRMKKMKKDADKSADEDADEEKLKRHITQI